MAKKPTPPQNATPPVPPESAPTTTPADMPLSPPAGPATSAVAPAAHAGPPTTKKSALIAKAKLGAPPTLLFYQNYHQVVRGDLRPAPQPPDPAHPSPVLTLYYSAARLPSAVGTNSGWQATAYVSYDNGQPPLALPLWSPTGQVVTSEGGSGFGEAQMLMAQTPGPVPHDAQDVAVWFSFKLSNGHVFWDSNYGQNYHFAFTNDVQVVAATVVVANPPAPSDELQVTVSSNTNVYGLAINYQVTNTMPDIPQLYTVFLNQAPVLNPAGCLQWDTPGIYVPHRSVVYFTIGYMSGGLYHLDDNNGQGYLVS